MKQRFDRLNAALLDFVEQREAMTMVLDLVNAPDLVYVLKYLESIDASSGRDVVLTYAAPCADGDTYIDGFIRQCVAELAVGNQIVAEGGGDTGCAPWPPAPLACLDARRGTLERVRALVEHVRAQLPDPAHRILIALLPIELDDPDGYARAVAPLIPSEEYAPWMAGVRVLLLDRRATPRLLPTMARGPAHGSLVLEVDFSPGQLAHALTEAATDRTLPAGERMMALVQLAGLDHAHGRFVEGIRKYGVAYAHYLAAGDVPMQGLCLLGAAYLLERVERDADAKERFRQALELGIAHEATAIMLSALVGLGGLHQRLAEWREARDYWRAAALLAKAVQNPYQQADAMDHAAVCSVALDRRRDAMELFEAARELAAKLEHWPRLVSVLEHLVRMEQELGRDDEARAYARQLAASRARLGAEGLAPAGGCR